jgi:hypothetical protein
MEFYHTSTSEFQQDARVQLHPCTDEWMRGERFGNVVAHGPRYVRVKLDTGRVVKVRPALLAFAN